MPFVSEADLDRLLAVAKAQGVSKTAIAKLRKVNQSDEVSAAGEAPSTEEALATGEDPTPKRPRKTTKGASAGHGSRRQPPPPSIEL